MTTRPALTSFLTGVLGEGTIEGSSLDGESVQYDVGGMADGPKPYPACDPWGDAAVISRCVDGAECQYIELDGSRTVIATRERRWQIEVQEGEVVVRAMGPGSPAYIRLMPNGDAHIVSAHTRLGTETAAHAMVMGDRLSTHYAALTVPTAMGPSGTPINAGTFNANVLSTKHFIDT